METDDISFVFFLVFSLSFSLCYFYTALPDTSDALYQSMTVILQTRFLLPVLAHEPFIVSIPRFSEAAGSTQTRRRHHQSGLLRGLDMHEPSEREFAIENSLSSTSLRATSPDLPSAARSMSPAAAPEN